MQIDNKVETENKMIIDYGSVGKYFFNSVTI